MVMKTAAKNYSTIESNEEQDGKQWNLIMKERTTERRKKKFLAIYFYY